MNNRQSDFFVDFSDCDDNIPIAHDIISHFNVVNPNSPTITDIVTDIKKNDGFDKNWSIVGATIILLVACKYDDIMKSEQMNELVNTLLSIKSFVEHIKTIDPNINEKNLKIYTIAFFLCMMLMVQNNGSNLDTSNPVNMLQQNHGSSYMTVD